MKTTPVRLGITAMLIMTLSACSYLRGLNDEKRRLSEEEKEGRIEMVLGDEAIEADPDLASTTIELPEARPLAS